MESGVEVVVEVVKQKNAVRVIVTYGQIQLHHLNSVHLDQIISVWFVFVSYCSVDLFCALVIMVMVWFVCPKLQTWLATCFGPDKPAYSKKEPSYSLLFPDISQVATCLTQRKPNYDCLDSLNRTQSASSSQFPNHSHHPPDESQIIACILPTLQSASSEQEPSCGTWTPGRYLYIATSSRQELKHYLNRSPATTLILTKLPKPSNSLHSPDSSTCIL